MATPPVITFTDTSNAPLASLGLVGAGSAGAVLAGTTSATALCRIWNNQTGAANISDARNCVLAVYDDATHQGAQATAPTAQQYLQLQVQTYDSSATGADTQFWAVGGTVKHGVPVNGATLAGAASAGHYMTVAVQLVVPLLASGGSAMQGIWLEYSFAS